MILRKKKVIKINKINAQKLLLMFVFQKKIFVFALKTRKKQRPTPHECVFLNVLI